MTRRTVQAQPRAPITKSQPALLQRVCSFRMNAVVCGCIWTVGKRKTLYV